MDVNTALTITAGTLDLNGQTLDLTGATFSNLGTLKLIGSETLTNFTNDSDSGTVEYYGTGTYATLAAGYAYNNLTFSDVGTYTLTDSLDVNGNLSFTFDWESSYSYRKTITIESDYVDDNLTAFPVLFSVTDTDLIGNVMSGSNYTIKFTNAAGTELPYEVEYYNNTTGQLIAWVKADSLSSSTDTNLYFYYGSSGTDSTEDAEAVWSGNNYAGVWHEDETTGTVYDSTSNDNDSDVVVVNQNAAGKINGADSFDGSNDYIRFGTAASLDLGQTFTVSAWINPAVLKNYGGVVSKVVSNQGGTYSYMLVCHNDGTIGAYSVASGWQFSDNAGIAAGSDYYLTWVLSAGSINYYVNGQAYGSDAFTYTDNTAHYVFAGSWYSTNTLYDFNGIIDEVNISSTARSAGWISTSYNNQDSPSTFHSTGSEASSASIAMGANDITVGGNFTNSSAGDVLSGTGAVIFDDYGGATPTSLITGSTTFPNLTCTTANKNLTFEAGSTQTITNTLTLTGTSGNLINLASSIPGTKFTFDAQTAGQVVSYISLTDSQASTNDIRAGFSTNGGGNDNLEASPHWIFGTYLLSGTVYSDRGTTGIGTGKTIALAINGTLDANTGTTNASSIYSIYADYSASDVILTYIDGDAVDGNAVTLASAADITDLNIYGNTLIARDETAGPITNATLNTAKGSLTDADIIYSVASSNLTVSGANDLLIWTGDTYAPGGNITIPGGFISNGTFTPGANTVTLTATDTDNIITSNASSFNNLT
ncbi:MAG: DUF2341 domain-containing protein, partial [Candidatus Omnitrophica bacterium]|nr:DUF2341 domain-containing protein [Candidatus Omnitrophota bacterium]